MRFIILILFLYSNILLAAVDKNSSGALDKDQKVLLARFEKGAMSKAELKKLQNETINYYGKAVPVLISVMKGEKYPDKNRWIATLLLGQIVGEKSAPFISKFSKHENWMLRLASLKTLLALSRKEHSNLYREALKDKSLLVRSQAIDNITKLDLRSEAPYVWKMLFDSENYYKSGKSLKRSDLIKKVVRAVGDLKYSGAKSALQKMAKKPSYKDIHVDIAYALKQLI